jgi:trigger factor
MSYLKIEKLEKTTKVFYEVSSHEWEHAIDHSYQALIQEFKSRKSKKTLVNGFRNESLPLNVYIKNYGTDALYEEALNHVFYHKLHELERVEEIEILSMPKIQDFDINSIKPNETVAFTFSFELENKPEIVLGQYSGLTVHKADYTVSAADKNEYLKGLLEEHVEQVVKEPSDATLENGDTAIFDFKGLLDGVAFEGGTSENYELVIGSKQFIPGFEEQMVGLKTGEEKDINVTFPQNYQASELAGKPVVFKIKLHEIKVSKFPEITDELVKGLNIKGVNTKEEFELHVDRELSEKKKSSEDNRVESTLVNLAMNNAKVDIPDSFLESRIEDFREDAKSKAKQYNIDFEMFLQLSGYTVDKFESEIKASAYHQIKCNWILLAIAAKENLVPTKEEIDEQLAKIASEHRLAIEEVEQRYSKKAIISDIQLYKAVSFIKDNALKI